MDEVDIEASLTAVARNDHVIRYLGIPMFKLMPDLWRYELLIKATQPQVIIETGSHRGGSARWFADQPGVEMVVSVDVNPDPPLPDELSSRILWVTGNSSIDPGMFAAVFGGGMGGKRTMVVLDSDHSAAHVKREIELYSPLVTAGCALVVEDGLFDYADRMQLRREGMRSLITGGGPARAIRATLARWSDWRPADGLSVGSPLSQNVHGWWVRRK